MKKIVSTILTIILVMSFNTGLAGAAPKTSTTKTPVKPAPKAPIKPAPKSTTPTAPKKLTVQEIAKKNTSVLLLEAYDARFNLIGKGSGFIISSDNKVVTNYHVIDKASYVKAIAHNGEEYLVEGVLNYNIEQDIAVLYIEDLKDLPYLKMGDSSKLALGEEIVAIGSPKGLQNTVSTGIVSSIRNNIYRSGNKFIDIQISAPISKGSSGGALFNMYGEVVGITYGGYSSGQNLNFAIPINEVKTMLNKNVYDSFENVMFTVYDQVKTDSFSQYMFQNYSTFYPSKGGVWDLKQINVVILKESPDTVKVELVMNKEAFENYMDSKSFEDMVTWSNYIYKEVRNEYPDKDIVGHFFCQESYSDKPSDFSENDLIYDELDKKWYFQYDFLVFMSNKDMNAILECAGSLNANGIGVIEWANGNIYYGEWKNNEMHGYGTLTYSDGTIKTGYWEGGKLVK